MSPSTDLQRFLDAQSSVFDDVLTELAAGRKRTHWMWFVFPQLKELGRSQTARHYGLRDRDEAATYWRHPILGARLLQCAELVLDTADKSAHDIFGSPDDLKLRSCVTLFDAVAPEAGVFRKILDCFYDGEADKATIDLLS